MFEPFDLYTVFVNEVSGSQIIFLILSLIFIAYLGSKWKFTNQQIIMIGILYIVIMSAYINALLPIALFLIAVFFGIMISRTLQKN